MAKDPVTRSVFVILPSPPPAAMALTDSCARSTGGKDEIAETMPSCGCPRPRSALRPDCPGPRTRKPRTPLPVRCRHRGQSWRGCTIGGGTTGEGRLRLNRIRENGGLGSHCRRLTHWVVARLSPPFAYGRRANRLQAVRSLLPPHTAATADRLRATATSRHLSPWALTESHVPTQHGAP